MKTPPVWPLSALLLGLCATASAGVCTPKDLSQANMDTNQISVFAAEAASAVYRYSFLNADTDLARASRYFTTSAWQSFMKALNQSGTLKMVLAQQMSVTSVPLQPPVIKGQGAKQGHYSWHVSLPLLVQYANAKVDKKLKYTINMEIVHTQPFVGERGVAIQQFNVVALKSDKKKA